VKSKACLAQAPKEAKRPGPSLAGVAIVAFLAALGLALILIPGSAMSRPETLNVDCTMGRFDEMRTAPIAIDLYIHDSSGTITEANLEVVKSQLVNFPAIPFTVNAGQRVAGWAGDRFVIDVEFHDHASAFRADAVTETFQGYHCGGRIHLASAGNPAQVGDLLTHELGHALGLCHAGDSFMDDQAIQRRWTREQERHLAGFESPGAPIHRCHKMEL
jgi:hypothetical protein